MGVVVVQNVTKQYGVQTVLDNVSLEINAGETVGLVGANGAGKTTLFRLMTREITPDLGTVTRAKGVEIGYLRQEPDVSEDRTLHEEVGSVFADLLALESRLHALGERIAHAHDDPALPGLMADYDRVNNRFIAAGGHTFEARLNEILGGLGFCEADHTLPMSALSGGQRCRAALAKLLLEDRPLLLLDEPTNHLDIDAVRWLEKFLAGHHGGAVIISHDRYLLDRLCDRIVEVADRKVASYPGNYTNYAETRALRELTRQRDYEKHAAFIAKERDFIARHLAGQRSQQAKGRRTRLERQLAAGEFVTNAPKSKRAARIAFDRTDVGEGTVLRVDELSMAYGDKTLFSKLTFQVRAGDHVGITGPNGVGKSTLLRIILGETSPIGGEFSVAPRLQIGYYAQDRTDLEPQRSVVDEIRAVRPEFSEHDARSYAARFMFRGDDAFKAIGGLSGGEQSRVRLATLILTQPDVLVLDEPTNHLDIPSREALEEALREFGGTIIAVSHDRYFLDRVVERLLVMRPEVCRVYAGNYSFYVQELEERRAVEKSGGISRKKARRQAKRGTKGAAPQVRRSAYDHLSIAELETLVIERETQLAALHERFGDPAVCRDPNLLAELQEEADAVSAELAEIDAAWQERANGN
ncbi:MAG: ATP-binding cassette domain-containing protein [Phycisphaerales bacterium]|nr:ATP-binding cassette domain-containing protein [Phycisphaerales bacterium]